MIGVQPARAGTVPRLLTAIVLLAAWTGTLAETCQYDGSRHAGVPHGFGICIFNDGEYYRGEYRNGKRHGQGVYSFSDGGRYEGRWRDGKPHGQGVYRSPDGGRHEGEWRNGKKHGHGVQHTSNGARFEGEWRDGKPNSPADIRFPDGQRAHLTAADVARLVGTDRTR